MGTLCDVQLYCRDQGKAKRVAEQVIADIRRLELRYSRYRDDSFLSTINSVAQTGGSIEVDDETASLLDYAETCYHESDGLFDISAGLLRKAWRLDAGRLPDPSQINALLDKIGWNKLSWQKPILAFPLAGMELDFGGIVKEYAADRAAALCCAQDIMHGVVNLGGDIKIIGPHPNGKPWRIGIKHPRKKDSVITTVELSHGALATSGDYERCILIGEKRYGHIINPVSGWPVQHLASVSVIADLCVIAGSASTIAMLKEAQGPAWLKQLGLSHLWVDTQGNSSFSMESTSSI